MDELENGVQTQAVSESAFFDFKEFPAASNSANRDLAKDLAAFSVDGGTIVLGVAENKTKKTFDLAPQDLAGWAERVSQIGLNRVQPPVRITCSSLVRPDCVGYLVVQVSPSPSAPHMVDGRYYGRSDTTNYQLSDMEVRALLSRSLSRRDSLHALLESEISRDLVPGAENARMVALAQPLSADQTLLLDAMENRDLSEFAYELLSNPVMHPRPGVQSYTPSFDHMKDLYRRATGVALSSYFVGPDRSVVVSKQGSQVDFTSIVDLEVQEDGGIRFFYGRASDRRGADTKHYLIVPAVAGSLSRIIQLARLVAEKTGFYGSWQFAVAVLNMRGSESSIYRSDPFRTDRRGYSADSYIEAIEVDYPTINAPDSVVLDRLIGRLLRTLHDGDVETNRLDEFPVRTS